MHKRRCIISLITLPSCCSEADNGGCTLSEGGVDGSNGGGDHRLRRFGGEETQLVESDAVEHGGLCLAAYPVHYVNRFNWILACKCVCVCVCKLKKNSCINYKWKQN